MPEEDQHEHDDGKEVRRLEELIAHASENEVSTSGRVSGPANAYRNQLNDANVNQAWKMRATIPVQ